MSGKLIDCPNCVYWEITKETIYRVPYKGLCWRHAPTFLVTPDGKINDRALPETSACDGCGDGEAK